MVIWSSPAWPRRSSVLPNAFTENGQVGSRNISKTRGPVPHTSGSARHEFGIRSFLVHLVVRPKHLSPRRVFRAKVPEQRFPNPQRCVRSQNDRLQHTTLHKGCRCGQLRSPASARQLDRPPRSYRGFLLLQASVLPPACDFGGPPPSFGGRPRVPPAGRACPARAAGSPR